MDDAAFDRYVQLLQQREKAEEADKRTTDRWRVFLSYSHADSPSRAKVEAILEAHELSYVVDSKDIGIGDDINDWALKRLRECSHYLLLLSRTSVVAPWCIAEYSMARGAGLEILVYLVDEVDLPPQLASRLVATNREELHQYFARDVIETADVDRFLSELLTIPPSQLQSYARVSTGANHWVLKDRAEREERAAEFNPYRLLDDYRPPAETVLWAIERIEPDRWRLEISTGRTQPDFHDVYHLPERRGLVIEPAIGDLTLIAAKHTDDDGTETTGPATGSVEEALYGHRLHGWPMSKDFWAAADARLVEWLQKLENGLDS